MLALLRILESADAIADTRALLVGVSDYDDSLPIADLAGPPNDVRLMASVLAGRGVEDITILADGVAGAQPPTHAAIVTAFGALAAHARPGDLAVVHLSGHGTQQIDVDGDEADGLDEVFLPIDSAPGPSGSGLIANALVDDEIGRLVDRIRAAGADVFLVMDSCHSGSGIRAVGDTAVARFVDPEVFGIATTLARETVGTAPVEATGDTGLPGGEIAFYATQSNELAYEITLGDGQARVTARYGLFSAKLAARLQTGEAMSYRQLFQAILSDINDTPGSASVRSQTPLWDGTLGDAPVFGSAAGGVAQFAVDRGAVQAGLVHGFAEGTLVALVADAAAGPDAVLGYAQLEAVEPTRAALRAVADTCVPRSDTLCAETAPVSPDARFARLVTRPVDRVLRLAPPRDLATGATLPDIEPLVRALHNAIAEVNASGVMQVVVDAEDNSVETAVAGDALWFGAPVQIGRTPTGLRWQPGEAPLADLLTRIARAEQTAAMLGAIGSGSSALNRNPVSIEARLRPVPATALMHPADFASIFEECAAALGQATDPDGLLPPGARLMPCEQVRLAAQGSRDDAYDLNRVFIDAQYCVSVVHERIEGRQPATGRITEDFTLCNDRCPGGPLPGGLERLIVVVTEAREHGEPLNLSGVLETCSATGARDIGGPASVFLADLESGRATRSASLRSGPKKVWVEAFRWWNMPRTELDQAGGSP